MDGGSLGLHNVQIDSYRIFLLLQFGLLSSTLESLDGQGSLPQCFPLANSVLKLFASFEPPASWNFILNPVSLLSSSSISLNFLIKRPPGVFGTKITVVTLISFPALWEVAFFLLLIFHS